MRGADEFNPPTRTVLTVALYGVGVIFSYLFFRTYASILTTEKLFVSSTEQVILSIILPVIFFAIAIVALTYALLLRERWLLLFFVPLAFFASHPFNFTSFLSGLLVLGAFLLFYYLLFYNIRLFRAPHAGLVALNSLRIPMVLISLAISLSFYHAYFVNTSNQKYEININFAHRFNQLFSTIYFDGKNGTTSETLGAYAITVLKNENQAVTTSAIADEERDVLVQLEVTGQPTDTMSTLLDKSVQVQLNNLIETYRSQIAVYIPLAFFFITQVFSSTILGVAFVVIGGIDLLLRRRGVDILKTHAAPKDAT